MGALVGFCRIPPDGLQPKFASSSAIYRSRAEYDALTKSVTAACWIGLVALDLLIAYVVATQIEQPVPSAVLISAITALILGILLGTYAFSPRGFELTPSGIVIRRLARSFEIPYEEIVEVERIEWTWKGIRLWASGGLHGFFGLFQLRGIGRVWMYVTNRHKVVLVRTRRGVQYAISPEDPDAFLRALSALARRARGRTRSSS